MPPGEVIVRTACPRRCESAFVRSDAPCSTTIRCPPATHRAISRAMFVVATPAPPPILTTIVMAKPPPFYSSLFLNRMQAGKGQTQRFIPAIHAIERLHRISSRAFHEIVQGGDHHH